MTSKMLEETRSDVPLPLDERQRKLIAGAVAEVDPQQVAVTRRLTPAQRSQQALSMIRLSERVAAYRLRKRQPRLNEADSLRIIRERMRDV
jgi:hypothetical protein